MSQTKSGIDLGLSELEKKELLHIARSTIEARATGEPEPGCEAITQSLQEKRGAFVSLHKHGQLRGCIGYISPVKPLYQTIRDMAAAAAFQDPRFPPIAPCELPELDIEISVLTPLRQITDTSEIQVGVHGIMITRGNCSGLLLPQVAAQNGWSREQFIAQTCAKAGLPASAWKDPDTKIHIFSADIF